MSKQPGMTRQGNRYHRGRAHSLH